MKIRYFAALDAVQVVMIRQVRIEPLRPPEYFDDICDADIHKGHEGPVDRVKRYVRVRLLDDLVEGIRGGVHVRLQQFTIDGDALGRDFEMMASACIDERFDFSGDALFVHISTK